MPTEKSEALTALRRMVGTMAGMANLHAAWHSSDCGHPCSAPSQWQLCPAERPSPRHTHVAQQQSNSKVIFMLSGMKAGHGAWCGANSSYGR